MDKEHDILQTYRRREDEFHLPLQEGGWDKLEKELASQPAAVRRMPYRWWVAAASVLLCIALVVPLFIPKETKVLTSDHRTVGVDAIKEPEAEIAVKCESMPDVTRKRAVAVVSGSAAIAKAEVETVVVEEESVSGAEAVTEHEASEAPAPVRTDVGPEPEERPVVINGTKNKKNPTGKKLSKGWSFGISGGSGKTVSGMNLNNQGPMDEFFDPSYPHPKPDPEPDPDPDENPDDPFARSLPQVRGTSYSYVHRLPLSVGFSVRKIFTDEFALESGLSYTYLYSDIRVTGTNGYVGDQRLHYLGIPLKANWTVYRKGIFSMYLSGGFLAEYCISARKRIMDDWMDLEMNRWQFSLNAAVGAELKLFRPMSVYLEPGVGYYFDSGNLVPTIRKERPWMFGLQLGLRFSY